MQQVNDDHMPLTGGGFRDFTRIAAANEGVVVAHSAIEQRAGVDQCPALHRRLAATY
ncbi:MAG: hypothetical protein CM15mP120_13040 [Pseudomonadota bacterium]|nr:MAG: hypothetical protein CM15mP120_13040 [Pseudomonadota bacterium]